jgi:two-component system chemotaxis response regulator CheY
MHILIVDDNPLNRIFLEEVLKPYGECTTAANGREALDLFIDALEAGQPFDLVTMDISMPAMDGHQALAHMRDEESRRGISPDQGVRAIVITSFDEDKHVTRAFFHGQAVAYLTKPISAEALEAELEKFGLTPG